jgi:signal transduction histidine kinase
MLYEFLTEERGELIERCKAKVADSVEEVRVAAVLDANARDIGLAIEPVEDGLEVEADRQTLASVAANLLQKAFKFSKPDGTVTLRTLDRPRMRRALGTEARGLS